MIVSRAGRSEVLTGYEANVRSALWRSRFTPLLRALEALKTTKGLRCPGRAGGSRRIGGHLHLRVDLPQLRKCLIDIAPLALQHGDLLGTFPMADGQDF